MNRRELIQGTGCAMGLFSMKGLASGQGRQVSARGRRNPNLLFFLTDEQRKDTLAIYGNREIQVPNLNQLASRSIVFDSYYVTQPLCTPSRGSIMTGLYPHTNGSYFNNIPLKKDTPVFVEMLKKGGYTKAYFGKWHLGDEICPQHGFDYWESTEDIYYGRQGGSSCDRRHSGYHEFLVKHGVKPDKNGDFTREFSNSLPKELGKPAYLADTASKFLEAHHAHPWVMYVSFLDPHPPFNSPNDKLYDPSKMKVGATFFKTADPTSLEREPAIRRAEEKDNPGVFATKEELEHTKAQYWGKVTLVDEMIGRVLRKLDELGMTENTIVVFTSDHGDMMGDHKLMFKSVMYQQAIQVPMLVSVPWLRERYRRVQQVVSGVDIVPTLLELMSQDVPVHLQGHSWAPYIENQTSFPERDAIIEWNGPPEALEDRHEEPLRTIVTPEGWKMTLAPGGEGELYNLNEDGEEKTNLFYRRNSLETIQMLAARIGLWQYSTGDQRMTFDQEGWEARRRRFTQEGVMGLD